MKKLLTTLISAALMALPLAVISTPAAAKTKTHAKAKHTKKSSKAKKVKAAKVTAPVSQ